MAGEYHNLQGEEPQNSVDARAWQMAAVIHTKPRRERFMSPGCLLRVPWHCLAPLLTPQTRVTQPLSSAYSHSDYPFGVWGRGAGRVCLSQTDWNPSPAERSSSSFAAPWRHSKCTVLAACPAGSFCLSIPRSCKGACACTSAHAQTYTHTPLSSPHICC